MLFGLLTFFGGVAIGVGLFYLFLVVIFAKFFRF